MIPQKIDIEALARQLQADSVAADDGVRTTWGDEAQGKLEEFRQTLNNGDDPRAADKIGETKLVLLDNPDLTLENSRDVAQALKTRTDADTVIVQSTRSPGVVSDTLTRYNIENNQFQMAGSLNPQSTTNFIEHSAAADHHAGLVNTTLLILVFVAIAITAASVWLARQLRA